MTNIALFSKLDQTMMAHAIQLARKGFYSTKPNPAVGCVMTQAGKVVATGWHRKAGLPHAEREAINGCKVSLKGATAYVTLEPCSHTGRTSPCANALIEAGIAKVIIAMQDPNPLVAGKGIQKLTDAGLKVIVGLLEQEAKALNKGFIHAMTQQLPFVRLKIAASVDGRTAMSSGESNWITGPESREKVHVMRAQHGAIITGIGTVLADDPSLNVRLSAEKLARLNLSEADASPLRVVLDAHLSMPETAKMLSLPGRTIIMTSKQTSEGQTEVVERLYKAGAEVVAVAAAEDKLDIESVLSYLHEVEQVRDVMVEAGAIVAGAFIYSGFVQEVHAFIAPVLMGSAAKPMFEIEGLNLMSDRLQFQFDSMDKVGQDLHLVLTPIAKESA